MKANDSNSIRQAFLDFFASKGHTIVPGSSLVPGTDPTLLFTNAGMVQFKDIFTGKATPEFASATTVQPCLRAGGKHNDLENVGYTARHHTLFEMLGNFSFGQYFKQQAISYAWEFITQILKLPVERLWATVYENDQESAECWLKEIGISPDRLLRLGEEDNFWAMGPTGPCGPCSEIFYDHGEQIPGGLPGSPDSSGDRYIEIWNLVFMQYERKADGRQIDLPKPCVDTGMGLERIAAVLQQVHSNYDTDLFVPLLQQLQKLSKLESVKLSKRQQTSLQVVADHIRSIAFLIADKILPDKEGRGYVLRRIIRRALRHSHKLSEQAGLLPKLIPTLLDQLGQAYPKLQEHQEVIQQVLRQEEELFGKTLDQGLSRLEHFIDQHLGADKTIPGQVVFELYDTYGFPPDLTADIAREKGLELKMEEFEEAMQAQQERARTASQFSLGSEDQPDAKVNTQFTGYQDDQHTAAVRKLYSRTEQSVLEASRLATDSGPGIVVLDKTPFYAEGGGQVSDQGYLCWDQGRFRVQHTQAHNQSYLHYGQVEEGQLEPEMQVTAQIDAPRRNQIKLNHSATHLLHAALRRLLGNQIEQKGSLVNERYLRFDFSCPTALSKAQCNELERMVNAEIQRNTPITTELMDFDQAKEGGAIALFGEKYDHEVRVLTMGDGFSKELCGGTHASHTGDLGLFCITSESGIAANVRRIEALTGETAIQWMQKNELLLEELRSLLKTKREQLINRTRQLCEENRTLQKLLDQQTGHLAKQLGDDLAGQAQQFGAARALVTRVEARDKKMLMSIMDDLKSRLSPAIIVLAAENNQKVSLVANVSQRLTDRIQANELIQEAGQIINARGGGKAEMAQAGGGDAKKLSQALDQIRVKIETTFNTIA